MPESTKTDETAAVEPENKEVVEEAKAALAKPSGDEETNNNSEETGTKVAEDGTTEDKAPETEQGSEKASEETEQEPEKESIEKPESNGTVTDLHRRIIEQVEYYFGDINLPRDRFLQEEIKKDSGWIPLPTMLKFKRLAQISSEAKVIAEALKHSKLMEVSEDGSKIRRNPETPLPENSLEYWQVVKQRTVYIKGFEQDTKLDDILNFVKQFGDVENVLMRREKSDKRAFKGSVFVTYKDQKVAEAFVKNDTQQFNGKDLLKMMQKDYWLKKQKEMKEKRLAARAAKQAKKQAVEAEAKKKSAETVHFVKGLVLAVENIPKEDCDLMKIKEFFKQFGDVQYVVYENGDETAQIRFAGEENGADKAWKAAVEKGEDGKVIFGGNELKGTVLDGEAEEEYWNNFSKKKADKQARMAKNRRGGGGKGRGRGRGGRDAGSGGVRNGEPRGEKRPAEELEGEPKKRPKRIVFPVEEEE